MPADTAADLSGGNQHGKSVFIKAEKGVIILSECVSHKSLEEMIYGYGSMKNVDACSINSRWTGGLFLYIVCCPILDWRNPDLSFEGSREGGNIPEARLLCDFSDGKR